VYYDHIGGKMSGPTLLHISDWIQEKEKELDRLDKKKMTKILGLNLGIAATDIVLFSSGLIVPPWFWAGASAMAIAFGSAFIFLSGAGLVYGNYRLLTAPENAIPANKIMTVEDYVEALNTHRGSKPLKKLSTCCSTRLCGCKKRIRLSGISFCKTSVPLISATRNLMWSSPRWRIYSL
jgi:hypothetical protein